MIMNSTNFKQYDTRWAKLGYPKSPYFIKNCGCGEVSIANCIIEMEKYAGQTPKTIQPYCVQFAAPNGNGTYFTGIPKMMEHYGMTEVKEHQTMNSLWEEMAKGNRVAILLMGSRLGGTKQIRWTSSAHFVAAVGYKKSGDKHMLYIKDSNSASSSRNGWLSYKEYLQGDVSRVWSGKLYIEPAYYPSTPYTGTLPKGTVKKGSKGSDVKAVQNFLNWCINAKLAVDGNCGNLTDKAIRKYQTQYKLKVDGIFGSASKRKAQEIIAKYAPTPAPTPQKKTIDELAHEVIDGKWGSGDERKKRLTEAGYDYEAIQKRVNELLTPTIIDKELDACKTQADWMKNSKYKWQSNPTIEKSKKYGTCVTYVACVLQRLGVLPSGKFIWHDKKGKVVGANDKMTVIYCGKTLKQLKSALKAGDIIIDGKPNVIDAGDSGSHIYIFTGKWNGDKPIIWDNHSAQQHKGAYPYGRNRNVIAIVRLK